jgi:hypothetical protein
VPSGRFRVVQSLDRHALGKIARLIDVAFKVNCEVISEKLQWNHSENETDTIDYGDGRMGSYLDI